MHKNAQIKYDEVQSDMQQQNNRRKAVKKSKDKEEAKLEDLKKVIF